jgi:hypothetical protein
MKVMNQQLVDKNSSIIIQPYFAQPLEDLNSFEVTQMKILD